WTVEWMKSGNRDNKAIYNIPVEFWSDKYIRMPVGAQDDVLKVVKQGQAVDNPETVGSYRDTATVTYTQDKSATTDGFPIDDWDNGPARWSVSYYDNGQR